MNIVRYFSVLLCLMAWSFSAVGADKILVKNVNHVISYKEDGENIVFTLEGIGEYAKKYKASGHNPVYGARIQIDVNKDKEVSTGLTDVSFNKTVDANDTNIHHLNVSYMFEEKGFAQNDILGKMRTPVSEAALKFGVQSTAHAKSAHPVWTFKIPKYEITTKGNNANFIVVFTGPIEGGISYYPAKPKQSKESFLSEGYFSKTLTAKFKYTEALAKKKLSMDKTPPQIALIEPPVTRGMKIVHRAEKVKVRGKATDESGIYKVYINGVEASLDTRGEFTGNATLAMGENTLTIKAIDKNNNKKEIPFTINREQQLAKTASESGLGDGKYYALLIGVQDYASDDVGDLDGPVQDARSLKEALVKNFTFEEENVTVLADANRADIIDAFDKTAEMVTDKDNLLIFYAGHGYWDEKKEQGFWLPSDASQRSSANWIRNSAIVDFISAIKSRHTLLVADACFSGGIFKTRKAFNKAPKAANILHKIPSRKAMTSGTLKEVPDKSVFLKYLIKRLNTTEENFIASEQLFVSFKDAVINNSVLDQIPQFGEIKSTGDEGGDFVFIKRQN